MVEKVDTARVRLWGEDIGAVSWLTDRGYGIFEYEPSFLHKELDVAPIHMGFVAARQGERLFSFPGLNRDTFLGLPGLLADALPDKFGNAIIDAWFIRNRNRHLRPVHHPGNQRCRLGSDDSDPP